MNIHRIILIESVVSVILGFSIAQICAVIILPLLGYNYHFMDLLLLNAVATLLALIKNVIVISFFRKYIEVKQ